MLQLQEIYQLPFTPGVLTEGLLRDEWFPEINSLCMALDDALEQLQLEQRFTVRVLIKDSPDGYRVEEMMTLWFEGHPVAIVQAAGRSGRDHIARWVTDVARYYQLLGYLLSMSDRSSSADFVSADTVVYEEEMFQFYGQDHSERFGYHKEKLTAGYTILGQAPGFINVPRHEADHLLVLFESSEPEPCAYIRRGPEVLKLVRALSDEDMASNPRLAMALEGEKLAGFFLYEPCKGLLAQHVLSV
jgi:hypothetical protein